jgi:hypothetical protein
MTKGAFFIQPAASAPATADGFTTLEWPVEGSATPTVVSDLAWNLAPLHAVPPQAADLVHLAAGAYMADRSTPRGVRFSRDLMLKVAVLSPDLWNQDVLQAAAELLAWLTGDTWLVSMTPAPDTAFPGPAAESEPGRPVSLLSGGLDSYLGAIDLLQGGQRPLFVAHKDPPTSVRHAQAAVGAWLSRSFDPAPSYSRFALSQARSRAEPSSRSRSLMFFSLGIAAASSSGSTALIVPENGYTSINLPLRPNRGGALSTRSTHPQTFHQLAQILDALAIKVKVSNPFGWMTKGEMMTTVAAASPPRDWADTAALTLSCSKLDGNWYGASPNLNCGLCVPCMVRRATFLKAGVPDKTAYVSESAEGQELQSLIAARRGDIEAVKYAIDAGVDPGAIDAGTWPPGYDVDRAEALVQRGLDELALLELP